VVVSDTRARRFARRRINVFMARRGGVSVNKTICQLAIACWNCVFLGAAMVETEVWT
jgi:hypothetical protein